jgi:hypothetical protein
MMFAIHNTCELSTRQAATLTGLFFLFNLRLELLLEILWICCGSRTGAASIGACTRALWIFTHDYAAQFRRCRVDWIETIAWHNRHGTPHGTLLLLQGEVARCEGSRQDLDEA